MWKGLIGLLALLGLAYATVSTIDDVQGRVLPDMRVLIAAGALQFLALGTAGGAWIMLFPPRANRPALARAFYASQLTKYLPAGGFLQAASQVAMSRHEGSLTAAAVRFPVFSATAVAAALSLGSALTFNADLPTWARLLAPCGLASLAIVDRRILVWLLTVARRITARVPSATNLPRQLAIVRCFVLLIMNLAGMSLAFAVLLGNISDVNLVWAASSFAAGWGIGFLVLPVPSGLFIREGVLLLALPGLDTGTILAASLAHRLIGLVVEALYAGVSAVAAVRSRTESPPTYKQSRTGDTGPPKS